MRLRSVWLVILLIGCGEGVPPLDELPLRDALRAEPDVVASLPPAARQRLATRLEAARTGDTTTDRVDHDDPAATAAPAAPAARVVALDRTRERRLGEPLVVGEIVDDVARPLIDLPPAGDPAKLPLPVVEGESAAATASLEARALEGDAGTSLRTLLGTSGARHLRRVVGWPIGAIAIGDTVYVDASWLVALAPGDGAGADGGVDGSPTSAPAGTGAAGLAAGPIDSVATGAVAPSESVTAADETSRPDLNQTGAAAPGQGVDAGMAPPPPPPVSDGPGFWDACAAAADCGSASGDACGGSTDDGSGDACGGSTDDGSDDACGGSTDDGSDDACGGSTDDGSGDDCSAPPDGGDGGCQVARGGRRAHFGTLLWLFAPVGFLLGRRP